jgi:hypothetical protein
LICQWIEPLTAPGELIIDPCCAAGEWGWIAGGMGRRYVGSDKKDQGAAWLAPPARLTKAAPDPPAGDRTPLQGS